MVLRVTAPRQPLPERGTGKRLLDVVLGTVLALVALPVIAVLAVAVCLSLRTWRPFFLQERIGRGGRPFTLPKLRTLPPQAPAAVDKYALAGVRTTRLGRFLRRRHIDELPQLLLVPSGRMSLVGPRPEMPWLLGRFDPEFVSARSLARPGCTGLWQIGADSGRLIGEVPEYDLYYLRHMSARLDVWVLWQSLRVIAGGAPVSCTDVPPWALRPRTRHEETSVGSLYSTMPAG
jgi:lipopolysaccharide/colanic/teichoic acid biosynthesis glycosyltransferase